MEIAMTILGIVLPLVISGWWALRNLKCQMAADKENIVKQFLLQKKYQDTKDSLPVLLEILDDLNKLHQAFVFKGIFCPPLEHRAPSLGMQDGLKDGELSYAQRGFQFHQIGLRIISNCRKIVYITPQRNLSETLKICKSLKEFLSSQEEGKKTHLDFMITNLTSYLSRNESNTSPDKEGRDLCDQFQKELAKFFRELDAQIEKELPYLAEGSP
jgi:hypothetical protein